MESQNVLGSKSEMVVGSQCDWSNISSEDNWDSEPVSDPDYDFKMVSDRALKGDHRGKFWNRGGKRR
ncbi:hypothetical protein MA16_Dca008570 [Dendrobium catenatum]|uniref:Uncharacterized protein n=1 Tax=Dendrobium catenatum TaxID=906689 RepID=A0A2I0WA31_9ASPA|nr:hypothetical protein MA16_Dca008570 [Dendrobium catenatum]